MSIAKFTELQARETGKRREQPRTCILQLAALVRRFWIFKIRASEIWRRTELEKEMARMIERMNKEETCRQRELDVAHVSGF